MSVQIIRSRRNYADLVETIARRARDHGQADGHPGRRRPVAQGRGLGAARRPRRERVRDRSRSRSASRWQPRTLVDGRAKVVVRGRRAGRPEGPGVVRRQRADPARSGIVHRPRPALTDSFANTADVEDLTLNQTPPRASGVKLRNRSLSEQSARRRRDGLERPTRGNVEVWPRRRRPKPCECSSTRLTKRETCSTTSMPSRSAIRRPAASGTSARSPTTSSRRRRPS